MTARAAQVSVPPLVPPSRSALDARRGAAVEAAASLATAATTVRALFGYVQRRLLLESLGGVPPVRVAGDDDLWPARRRFLTAEQLLRLDAVERGLGYVDGRVRRRADGRVATVLDRESPFVLNALSQGIGGSPKWTNAGLIRQTDVGFDPSESAWTPPSAAGCGQLLDDAVIAAGLAPADPWVRAAWLAITVLSVHPFVDGNGRTARLLYQLVLSEGEPFDWWSIERWSADRAGYIDAIKAVQVGDGYRSGDLDVSPFLSFALECSIDGAQRCRRRLDDLAVLCSECPGDETQTLVEVAVRLDRNARLDELRKLPIPRRDVIDALRVLERSGRLMFDETFGWNVTDESA